MIYTPWEGCEICVTSLADPVPRFSDNVELLIPRQTHSANVAVVTDPDTIPEDTDAVITRSHDFAVGVRTADCQPILLYAPDIRAVAAIHAGWKGTKARIAAATVNRLAELGADPQQIKAFLGPSVCGNCYEVSPELVEEFRAAGFHHLPSPNHLDLKLLNLEILTTSSLTTSGLTPNNLKNIGLNPDNIIILPDCTLHTCLQTNPFQPLYPSWRRTPGTTTRLISAIRLTD